MQRYQNAAQDALGNVIQGMSVSVFLHGTQTLATIFSDNGVTIIPNPVTTDALGTFFFYAANGRYDLQFSKTGLPTTQLLDVLLFDAGAIGGVTVAGQVVFGVAGGFGQDPNLVWDNVNKRLGIGQPAPTQALDVVGSGKFSTSVVTPLWDSGAAATGQVKINGTVVLNINTAQVVPTVNLGANLGSSGNQFASGFFGTSVVTPLISGSGSAITFGDSIQPSLDAGKNVGSPTFRCASVFTTAVDSGTTGSLAFKTNNGVTQVVVVHIPSAVNQAYVSGSPTGSGVLFGANPTSNDADVGVVFFTKGAGRIDFQSDGTGATQFQVLRTASANRNITATGAVSPNNPILGATGGGVAVVGTTTNDSAASGQYGEYTSATVIAGSAVALTTATPINITSLTLGAGDWDVTGMMAFQFAGTTSYTNLIGAISTLTGALDAAPDGFFDYETAATVPTAAFDQRWVMPTRRISLAASATIFLVAQATFTVSTAKAYGFLRARRVR